LVAPFKTQGNEKFSATGSSLKRKSQKADTFMVTSKFDVFFAVLIVAYISVVAVSLKNTILGKKKKKKRAKKSRSESSKSSKSRLRRTGKMCPRCKKTIDKRRSVCHHCGNKFDVAPGAEPHPDEVKAGIVQPKKEEGEEDGSS
jgi:hypothetical protein